MVAAALAGKAACYEVKEDYESAAKYFAKAAGVSDYVPSNSEYLLNAGINYLKIKNINEAKTVLTKVKRDYSKSLAARQADKYLALTNG